MPFVGVGQVAGVICQFDDGLISLNMCVDGMRLVNLTKAAGKGKMVCGVDGLVFEENDTMINQCVLDCVFLASAEWSAKINTANLSADVIRQFCDAHG